MLAVGLLDDRASSLMLSVPTILLSLGCFLGGVLAFGQLANLLHATHARWWLLASSLAQTALSAAATALQHRHPHAATTNATVLGKAVLALLALSAGAQVAMVRELKVTDMTTAMATAAFKGGGSGLALLVSVVVKAVAAALFLVDDEGKGWDCGEDGGVRV